MTADWYQHADCKDADTDLWFSHVPREVAYAKAICEKCPVRIDCLEHAISEREKEGIWGGLEVWERDRLRRRRQKERARARVSG